MIFKKRAHTLKYVLLLLAVVGVFYGLEKVPFFKYYFENPILIQNFILDFGVLAPIGVILINVFQAIFSIIPSELLTIVAGFIFGPILGLTYSLIGAFLGSAMVFILARHYGKNLALKLFEKKELVHFNLLFKQKGLLGLFLARVAPIFPDDLVSFTAGLTKIPFWWFNLISTAGFAATMIIYTYFGSELSSHVFGSKMIILTVLVIGICMIGLFKDQIKKKIIKDIHTLEKKGRMIEKEVEREFRKI
jgi:uncharacterized membrane protein YdjX (TVP38/TMEM64 family)